MVDRVPVPDPLPTGPPPPRLDLLFGYAPWRSDEISDQLPALLGPLGIRCHRVGSVREATAFVRAQPVHIAVVDMTIPMEQGPSPAAAAEAGPRVLQLLRRLEQPPPTVVVRPPQPSVRESGRSLSDALREGAFAVLDGPVRIESMLEVLRRVVRRHFADHWPAA